MAPETAKTLRALLSHGHAKMGKFSAPAEPLPTEADDVLGAEATVLPNGYLVERWWVFRTA
jgi:hypothetical protein